MEFFVTIAEHAEQLGVVGILIIIIGAMTWFVRHLYQSDKKCNDARLVDAEERGEIKKELGVLSGKIEAMYFLHQQNLAGLVQNNPPSNP